LSLLTGVNILIADDNLLNQKIVSLILKRYGGVVSFASNGNEVIKMVSEGQYDVILMDVQMPELDGFATTRVLRNDMKSDIPVIALTADKLVTASEAGGAQIENRSGVLRLSNCSLQRRNQQQVGENLVGTPGHRG